MDKLIKFYNDNLLNFDWIRCSDDVKDFIICQFALESNFGNSRLARDCNNYCGMRFPCVRIASSCEIDESSGFAKYPSKFYCIVDYFLALQYHHPLREDMQDVERFKSFIKKFYCPDKDYIERITQLFNQLKFYKNGKI